MKITKRQLKRIIKEEKAKLLNEGGFKERHTEIQGAIYSILEAFPGISGLDLVAEAQSIFKHSESYEPLPGGNVTQEEIFTVLDDLQEDGQVFFNVEEDAWYLQGTQPQSAMMGEGMSLDEMPDAWRQILGNCLKDKK